MCYFTFTEVFLFADFIEPSILVKTVMIVDNPTIFPNRKLLSIIKLIIKKIIHVVVSTPISINKP